MFSLALTLGAAVASTWLATPVAATSCTAFDSYFNLYAFGIKGRDFAFGPQSGWANAPTGTVMPTTGRPPFDGSNTQCFTSEYNNAVYFLNADASQPNAIHIFNATSNSWSTQQTTAPAGLDPTSSVSILDHDTDVFFTWSNGNLYQADMSSRQTAPAAGLPWEATNAPNFDASGYTPVMGLAQNHIHFLNHATNADGQANIFVIHFAYWQPEVQTYPAENGATFPQKHGQVASFFAGDLTVQKKFAFLPDDMSNTYVIDVEKNTTTVLPAPPASAGFASNPAGLMGRLSASPSALVYLSPANELQYFGVDQNNVAAAATNKWAPISSSELVAAAAVDPSATVTGTASATASGMATSRAATGTASVSGSASKPSGTSSSNGAMGMSVGLGAGVAAVLVGLQAWLMF